MLIYLLKNGYVPGYIRLPEGNEWNILVCTSIYTHIHIYVRTYIYTCICIYIYIYIHAYVYTHAHVFMEYDGAM